MQQIIFYRFVLLVMCFTSRDEIVKCNIDISLVCCCVGVHHVDSMSCYQMSAVWWRHLVNAYGVMAGVLI